MKKKNTLKEQMDQKKNAYIQNKLKEMKKKIKI